MNTLDQYREGNIFEHYKITADPGQGAVRIDKFLTDRIPHITRTKLQDGIRQGFVKVNDKITKPNYKIRPHDVITVYFSEPPRDKEIIPEDIPLTIVYEDEFLLVVNKPAGMVVHPACQNWTGTLVNALAYYFQHLPCLPGNEGRPGLVHRIDKDTSGLMVIAKTQQALTGLAKQFFDHSVDRKYRALVWGDPDPPQHTISMNVGRSLRDRRVITVFLEPDKGQTATTHYKVLTSLHYVSLLECTLETGRTHQIRAHMKHRGHPLFGDVMYGGDRILKGPTFSKYRQFVKNCFMSLNRQALHAKTLGFVHPITNKALLFDSDLPADMQMVLSKWQRYMQYNHFAE